MVVPVLMINCQVSENLKSGPVVDQMSTTRTAVAKAAGRPTAHEVCLARRVNQDWDRVDGMRGLLWVSGHRAFPPRGRRNGWAGVYAPLRDSHPRGTRSKIAGFAVSGRTPSKGAEALIST